MRKLFGLFLLALAFLVGGSTGRATLVNLPTPLYFPGLVGSYIGGLNFGTAATLDASGEYITYVVTARENMTLSHIGFRAGTVANAPTVDVRIETVDGSGIPSGTLWNLNGTGANPSGTSGTVTTNSNPIVALADAAIIVKGDVFAVKILWGGVATSSIIVQHIVGWSPPAGVSNLPYTVINTTGSAVKASPSTATVAFGSSLTTFYNVLGSVPTSAVTSNSQFNNTNSAKRGLKFVAPMNARAIGMRWVPFTAVGNYNAVLYDTSDNVLATVSMDGDVTAASGNAPIAVYWTSAYSITAGTTYRIAIEPTSATNVNVGTVTLPSSDYYSASPASASSTATYTTQVSSTWTDSTTQLPIMDLIIDQVDNGAGIGGSSPRTIGG